MSCAYHGWQFDGDGSCTKMPSTVHCRNVSVAALPCVEKDGFIWVWPGEGVPPEVRANSPLLFGQLAVQKPGLLQQCNHRFQQIQQQLRLGCCGLQRCLLALMRMGIRR